MQRVTRTSQSVKFSMKINHKKFQKMQFAKIKINYKLEKHILHFVRALCQKNTRHLADSLKLHVVVFSQHLFIRYLHCRKLWQSFWNSEKSYWYAIYVYQTLNLFLSFRNVASHYIILLFPVAKCFNVNFAAVRARIGFGFSQHAKSATACWGVPSIPYIFQCLLWKRSTVFVT